MKPFRTPYGGYDVLAKYAISLKRAFADEPAQARDPRVKERKP